MASKSSTLLPKDGGNSVPGTSNRGDVGGSKHKNNGAVNYPVIRTEVFTKFWTVKRKDCQSFNQVSPIAIYKSLMRDVGEVDSVSKSAHSGNLVIGARNQSQADKLKNLVIVAGHEVSVSANDALNSSKGVIYCKDLMNCSEEEILEDLHSQGVTAVSQVKRQGQPTGTFFLTFNTRDCPERLRVAFYKGVRVRKYVPAPLRCFMCFKFGHVSFRCKLKTQMCSCGQVAHPDTQCVPPLQCVNCGLNHDSKSRDCPEYLVEKEIQRVKLEHRLTYPEASRMVRSGSYAMPAVSYAKKAAAVTGTQARNQQQNNTSVAGAKVTQMQNTGSSTGNKEKASNKNNDKNKEKNSNNNSNNNNKNNNKKITKINNDKKEEEKKEGDEKSQKKRKRGRGSGGNKGGENTSSDNTSVERCTPTTPPPSKRPNTLTVETVGSDVKPQPQSQTGMEVEPLPPRTSNVDRGSNTSPPPTPTEGCRRSRQPGIPPKAICVDGVSIEENIDEEEFQKVKKKGWPKGKPRKNSLDATKQ